MQFTKTWELVLEGKKTQTRRLVKPGDFTSVMWTDEHDKHGRIVPDQPNHGPIVRVEMPYWLAEKSQIQRVMNDRRTVYLVGKEYAVQPGRGKAAVARIRITGIRREDVRNISHEDAVAEGFTDRSEFLSIWTGMHDKKAHFWEPPYPNSDLYEYCDSIGNLVTTYDWNDISERLESRPAHLYEAWALTFEVVK